MSIKGFATPEGTERYRKRFEGKSAGGMAIAEGHFRASAQTQGLHLSSLGMGTYLGAPDAETSAQMTQAAVDSVAAGAVNVLDTAINYRYQLSERSLGEALRQLLTQGVARDEIFLCSKNGFLSPDADKPGEDFRSWFRAQYIDSGRITPDDIAGGMHCMAPGYLDDQLNRSLANLGVETLDLMYLHNAAESQIPAIGADAFMGRLRRAFECYEQARAEGRLRYYGLATWNCFRVMPEEEGYLSLEAVVRLAEEVGGAAHGFRFVQLPFNLAFTEALTLASQPVDGELASFLEAATEFGIGLFTSVPLLQGQLLSQTLPTFDGIKTPAQACLQFVRSQWGQDGGIIAPLAGHKQPSHVSENLAVAATPPLMMAGFEAMSAG